MAENAGPNVQVNDGHVSSHGTVKGTEGAHPIASEIVTDPGTAAEARATAYTNVDGQGNVTDSGFDSSTKST